MVMLRESSRSTPEEVLLGDRRFQDERRPEQAERQQSHHRDAERGEHDAITQCLLALYASIGRQRTDRDQHCRAPMASAIARETAKVKSPCSNTNTGYLKKKVKMASIDSRPFYLEGHAGEPCDVWTTSEGRWLD